MHTAQVNVGRSTLTIETGKLAKQADGAVTVRYGDTIVIVHRLRLAGRAGRD